MINRFALSTALLLGASTTLAGVDITRMTTVVDDSGGSYTTTTQVRVEQESREGTSVAEFSNFRADGERAGISGTISDIFEKSPSQSSSVVDGELVLGGTEQTLEISFDDLIVTRADGEVTIEGEIVANGETYATDELPQGLAKVLRRLFLRLHR